MKQIFLIEKNIWVDWGSLQNIVSKSWKFKLRQKLYLWEKYLCEYVGESVGEEMI